MPQVTSADGTPIAYERAGSGPTLVLVGGALDDGSENAPLGHELADRFTVLNYARRGRGESGDTAPYALEREFEDLAAVISEAGTSAFVFGASSGGALSLEAAAAGLPIDKLVVHEVPYDMSEGATERHVDYRESLATFLAEDRPDAAVEHAWRSWGAPDDGIQQAKQLPTWPHFLRLAPTLLYDAACMGDNRPPTERFASISQPTLVMTGDGSTDYFGPAADAIAASVPGSERRTIEGQQHVLDPSTGAEILSRFFDA